MSITKDIIPTPPGVPDDYPPNSVHYGDLSEVAAPEPPEYVPTDDAPGVPEPIPPPPEPEALPPPPPEQTIEALPPMLQRGRAGAGRGSRRAKAKKPVDRPSEPIESPD